MHGHIQTHMNAQLQSIKFHYVFQCLSFILNHFATRHRQHHHTCHLLRLLDDNFVHSVFFSFFSSIMAKSTKGHYTTLSVSSKTSFDSKASKNELQLKSSLAHKLRTDIMR